MMGVIILFFWFVMIMMIVLSVIKNVAGTKNDRPGQQGQAQQMQRSQMQGQAQQMQQNRPRAMTDADRARLEEYRRKKTQGAYVPSRPTQSNQNLDTNRRRSSDQPDIVERAKANSRRYAALDETLQEMESAHGHSERVSSAVAGYVESEREAHRRMHEEPMPRVEDESCLGTLEDLMVKGYDGNLSFERDFIGEAQDFLASITMPG